MATVNVHQATTASTAKTLLVVVQAISVLVAIATMWPAEEHILACRPAKVAAEEEVVQAISVLVGTAPM